MISTETSDFAFISRGFASLNTPAKQRLSLRETIHISNHLTQRKFYKISGKSLQSAIAIAIFVKNHSSHHENASPRYITGCINNRH